MPGNEGRVHLIGTPSEVLPYVAVFSGIKFLVAEGVADVGVDRVIATTPGMPGVRPREQWLAIFALLIPVPLSVLGFGWLAGLVAFLLVPICWPLVARVVNNRTVARTRGLASNGDVHDFFSLWATHAVSVRDRRSGYTYTRSRVVGSAGETTAEMLATGNQIALDDAGPTMDELPTRELFRKIRERVEERMDGVTMNELIDRPAYAVVPGAAGNFKAEYEKQCGAAAIGHWLPRPESDQALKPDFPFSWGYRAPTP